MPRYATIPTLALNAAWFLTARGVPDSPRRS